MKKITKIPDGGLLDEELIFVGSTYCVNVQKLITSDWKSKLFVTMGDNEFIVRDIKQPLALISRAGQQGPDKSAWVPLTALY